MDARRTSSHAWLRGTAIGVATLAVLTALKLALEDSIGRPTPFLTYFGAVMVAAWFGGRPAGLVTTGLSATLGYVGFIAGRADFEPTRVALQLGVFTIEGVLITWLVARLADERRGAELAGAQLDAAMDAIDEGITMLDAKGGLVFVNRRAAELSGFDDAASMIAAGPQRVAQRFEMRAEDGSVLAAERLPSRAVLAGEQPKPLVLQYRLRGEATMRWSEVEAAGVRDLDGTLRFVVNVFRDVTARREQDQALRLSQAWFSTTLRSIGDAVVATDARGNVTFANPVAEQLTGWTLDDAKGRPLADVFDIRSEIDHRRVPSPVDRVLAEGIVVGLANHTLLVRRDGTEVPIDDSAAPIRDAAGELVGVVLVFRDVSVARREEHHLELLAVATAELGSSLDYATTLATVARLAVPNIADWCAVDIREDGAVRRLAVAHVDPAKVELVRDIEREYPPDPNAPQGVAEIMRTGRAELIPEIPEALLDAAARDDRHRQLIRDLQLHSYIGVPILRGREVIGVITLVMAESRRRYDERDLVLAQTLADRAAVAVENARLFRDAERARREAELANRTKDEFLAMLGHELRNPLAPIVTALELMQSRPHDGGTREREIIDRQVRHMVRLVDDLLDVSRIARGKVELARAAVALHELVAKGLEMAAPLVQERRHRVTVAVPADLVVDVDGGRIAQVIANLLNNAAKYTPPGGHIEVHAQRDGEHVVLSVRDDGIGIAPDMLAHVFDAFVQEPQAIDRAQGGLGLGLTIARNVVEAHGGSIAASSEGAGRGTCMTITLPIAQAPAAVTAAASPQRRPAKRAHRVLVVDDNEDALELMIEALTMLGHEPFGASDGEKALALAAARAPTVALLDLGLPVMDGYVLARRLRELPGLADVRVIAITGYDQPADRERTKAAGFSAHLVKPVSLDAIAALLAD